MADQNDDQNDDRRSSQPLSPSPPGYGPGKTPRGRARLPSSRRRDKPQWSCNLCRQRKLRCDRQHPCSNCTKRELGQSCTYPSPKVARRPDGSKQQHQPTTIQDRIQHLEKLLVDMMQSHQSPESSTAQGPRNNFSPELPSSPIFNADGSTATAAPSRNTQDVIASPASDCGSMHLTRSGASYVSSAHWAAVLDDIAELKMHFEKEEQMQDSNPPPEPAFPGRVGPQLLYGCQKFATREEILSAVPPRPVVDQLVSCYFNSFEMSPAVLHSLQFLEEYEEFWERPSTTPVIWLGSLFAIMCLATQIQRYRLDDGVQKPVTISSGHDLQLQKSSESLRQKVVQCLVLGDYVKGGPYVIETLMLYFAVELFLSNDAEIGVWILLGTIMQLAMHMGYHRDPNHFKGMTPFASEMQRRVWATIVEVDLAISAQMGLPRLIKPSQTDTTEPLNIEDRDFNKYTTEMPLSRPEIDQTPMLFRLVKARLFKVVGSIWDFTTDNRQYNYTEVMDMDVRLRNAHASIPECLKWRSIAQCIADSPQAVMQKVTLQIIYHRARIVLHRRYLRSSSRDTQCQHSQQECLDAALRLLEYQHMLQEKTERFGQLYYERWRLHSLVNHDFLLAASILCFYLQQVQVDASEGIGASIVETIRESLRKSHNIWLRSSSSSKEAMKAAKALSIVLGRSDTSGSTEIITDSTTPSGESLSHSTGSDFIVNYRQDDSSGLGVQFPVFDATVWTTWTTQATMEPTTPFQVSIPTTTPNDGAHIIDAMNAMSSQQWPWNN